jgi:hypothetical protein
MFVVTQTRSTYFKSFRESVLNRLVVQLEVTCTSSRQSLREERSLLPLTVIKKEEDLIFHFKLHVIEKLDELKIVFVERFVDVYKNQNLLALSRCY